MTDYKSVTHTINELLARKKIKAVPRKEETPRKELKNVARPDDDREGDVPTRQGEIQMKVIDEQEFTGTEQIKPKVGVVVSVDQQVKKPKKLEIQDVGKQPPTKVDINPELDNTPNLFASKEDKGKLVEGDKGFDAANKLKRFQKSHDFTGGDDTPDPRARREAEAIAKFARQFQGKTLGSFKITGKLTDKDIEQGARIRARLNKLKEAIEDKKKVNEGWEKYNSISIQYQTTNGKWVTVRKTTASPSNIILAMKDVQKAYNNNRVRAIDPRGSLIDMLATPGAGPQTIDQRWPEPPGQEVHFMNIEIPKSKRPITLGQALGAWWRGDTVEEEKDYVEVRGRKIYGFKGSPGHKQMQKAAKKHSEREKARRCADKIKNEATEKPQDREVGTASLSKTYAKDTPGQPDPTINELKKETLLSFMNKRDKQPQKDAAEMKKVWQYGVWPAKERVYRDRFWTKKKPSGEGWKKYHAEAYYDTPYEPARASDEEKEAYRRFMKTPSSEEEAMHKAQREWRAHAFRRIWKEKHPVKEETSKKELRQAKKRTAEAWWDNKQGSLKNYKQVSKALRDKELDEQKKKEDTFTQELGQRGATGTWGTKLDKISTTLKPGPAEVVRSWAQRAGTPEYVGSSLATGVLATSTHTSTLPLMLKGSEIKRRKPASYGEETILRVLDKIVKG